MRPYDHHSAVQRRSFTNVFKNQGFSLIESLVIVTIIAILAGIAVPDFNSLISKNRVNAAASELFTSLSAARSYAINQHALVHMCALNLNDSSKCSEQLDYNANWSNGWLIFSDINGNDELDSQDTVLKVVQATNQTNIVFNQQGRLRFFPDGSARSAGFYLCDKAKNHFRHILLLYTGRVRTNKSLNQQQQAACGTA